VGPNSKVYKQVLLAAKMSRLAYKGIDTDSAKSVGIGVLRGFPKILNGRTGGTARAVVWLSPDARILYVSFRGTSTVHDVLSDISISSVKLTDGMHTAKVHSGFHKYFMSLFVDLKGLMKTHALDYDRVVLTGHSLGGAIASIASIYIHELVQTKKISCITFGAPKVGNQGFATIFSDSVRMDLRVIISSDPVPKLPPGKFKHPTPPYVINWGQTRHGLRADDHKLKNYIQLLEGALVNQGGKTARGLCRLT